MREIIENATNASSYSSSQLTSFPIKTSTNPILYILVQYSPTDSKIGQFCSVCILVLNHLMFHSMMIFYHVPSQFEAIKVIEVIELFYDRTQARNI